jgi:uncharacterized protein YbjT (DUF2867 family)
VIVVAGATSSPGRLVVDALLERGPVRVLVRGAKDAEAFSAKGAEVVRGDVRDAQVIADACRGAHTVVSMIGRHFAETADGLWAIDARANEALVDAARSAGVKRFVLLSALFADRDYAPVLIAAKRQAERAVVASGLDYAIVRPSTFTVGASSLVGYCGPTIERWGVAVVPHTQPISFVALRDVADAVVAATVDTHPARVVDLGGPEALTMTEGAQRVAAILGKPVRIVHLPRLAVAAFRRLSVDSFGRCELLLFTEMLIEHG